VDGRAYDQLSRMTHLQELVLSQPLPADDMQVSHFCSPLLPPHSCLPTFPSPTFPPQPDMQHRQWLDHIPPSFLLVILLMLLAAFGGDNVRCLLDIPSSLYGGDHSDTWHQVMADNAEMMQLTSIL